MPENIAKLIETLVAVFTTILAKLGVDAGVLERFEEKLNGEWVKEAIGE